jgi:hypothetical protein
MTVSCEGETDLPDVKVADLKVPEDLHGTVKVLRCFADQSNSSVEKAGLLGSVPMRLLPTDDKCRLRGATLEQAIKSDREKGLIPCYVSTVTGSFKQQNTEPRNFPNHWHIAKIKFKARSIKSIKITTPTSSGICIEIGILHKMACPRSAKVVTVMTKAKKCVQSVYRTVSQN